MATSGRQSALFGAQDWKRLYQTYSEADFQSYDYETLRKNFIDYLTTYYPETFNDYIENSEYVALLDVIAFMGQALAFRNDLNTRENFIDTAERRDSVIKLANLVSYTPKRNIAGQGLIKVTAISTTETVYDVNGVNLNNTVVLWNDPANQNWQEQFNAILNASLVDSQRVGRPGNSNTILGIKTDEYTISIPADQNPVFQFQTEVDGTIMTFELVNVTSAGDEKLYEPPPAPIGQFNIVYQNDQLGYGSINTGFFFYFKQGTLQAYNFSFAEAIQNNFQQIDITGINDTDTWLYQTDDQGAIIAPPWTQVDNIYTNPNLQSGSSRKVFNVSSRFNDQVTYNFGDGIFGEVPVGTFVAYVRSGNSLTYTISPSEMQGIVVNMNYISRTGSIETLTFTLSLQTTVNTAQQREPISQIKERAPSRFYTQNRMVNGEDYASFPFATYNSIIKSKAVNRSSIGISRNLDLLDPTAKYSSTNTFADDGALYTNENSDHTTFSTLSTNLAVNFLSETLPALLAKTATVQYYYKNYPRYTGYYGGSESIDRRVYWKTSSIVGQSVTGYFYIKSTGTPSTEIPVSVGAYSSYTMKYIGPGAQIKVLPPTGYYFDKNNRLAVGSATTTNGGRTYMWTMVTNIVGDGKNYGNGAFSDGTGPVRLRSFIPTGCYIDTTQGTWYPPTLSGATGIIPSFDNTLSTTITNQIIARIRLEQDFSLVFDNSLTYVEERWSIEDYSNALWFVRFSFNSINKTYLVTIRNTNYYFGSVDQIRFSFDEYKRIYDPKSGLTISDFVNVLGSNSNPSNTGVLGLNYVLNITEQATLSDGYPDDYTVKVSSINNSGYTYDPDFFYHIIGTEPTYVFFQLYNDVDTLYRTRLLSAGTVIYSYATRAAISEAMYDYPIGTVFYATGTNLFYQTSAIVGSVPTVLQLTDVSNSYFVQNGRQTMNFQYRHNSSNTTRIDPGTTNIIDMYLVTQAYYTAYQNWINDTTGTVPMPAQPTIQQLQQSYGALDDFKMISDSMILNSVTFKPLFGTKASPELRGAIKVIKNSNVTVSDSQIRSSVLSALNNYFTLDNWSFGDTFYFSELTAYLHVELAGLISSVVLVPADPDQTFGDLYEIRSQPNEIFVNGATTSDIVVISALTPQALQRI
jgi:hypothetical protein